MGGSGVWRVGEDSANLKRAILPMTTRGQAPQSSKLLFPRTTYVFPWGARETVLGKTCKGQQPGHSLAQKSRT